MTSPTTKAGTVTTTHTAYVAAPARAVYGLIADVARWPYLFSAVVHVDRMSGGATGERLRLWTAGNGAVRSWTSRRSLDPDGLRIRFRHENPSPPLASMAGEWIFVPMPGDATSVVLLHHFQATGDDPGYTQLIRQAVDRNSTAELAAMKGIAELGDQLATRVYTFSESVVIPSTLRPVYEFLYRAQQWPQLLPHVSRLILDEAVPNLQTIEMDMGGTGTDGGASSLRTMKLVRVCFPFHTIVYKQLEPPEVLSAHVGTWLVRPMDGGVRVTATNTVLVRPDRVRQDRPGAPVEPVEDQIRQALRDNCLATLLHAKRAFEHGALALPGDAERAVDATGL